MDNPIIAIDLEKYRKAAGISEEQLSETTGIPRTTLRRKMRSPSDFTVGEFVRVTKALSVPAKALKLAS